ncbi:MAG: prolyl oligopeptidase family serine peptidase [Candidatus Hydrogenedentes bacterium]|nr:prolyl oligopeptidase family serine peptidase [Candidatus Hydrogenedentota bacterium]
MRVRRALDRRIALTMSVCAIGAAQAAPLAHDAPETIAAATLEEFPVSVGARTITVRVLSPPAGKLAADPALLFMFALDSATTLSKRPYCLAAEHFLSHGHRAASFDLPAHGDRVGTGRSGIEGMRDAYVAGEDVFAAFVDDGKAAIDECIKCGLAKPGRIAVAGTSRGGYMALRLLAGDDRIAAGAGFAPVTDWRALREFEADKERADVRDLQLTNFVSGMTGKRVFVAIGKTDARVSTERCTEFANALKQANADAGHSADVIEFHLTDDAGHSLGDAWYDRARTFLLNAVTAAAPSP